MIRFLLQERLAEKNRRDDVQRTWDDVAAATGLHRSTLASLAGNTRLTATSTRVVETLCRYFECPASGEAGLFEFLPTPLTPPLTMEVLYGKDEEERFKREYATRRRQPRMRRL